MTTTKGGGFKVYNKILLRTHFLNLPVITRGDQYLTPSEL